MRFLALLLVAAAPLAAQNWTIYGGNLGSQRFSPLKQVTAANVNRLGVNWVHQTRVEATTKARRSSRTAFSTSPGRAATLLRSTPAPAAACGTTTGRFRRR